MRRAVASLLLVVATAAPAHASHQAGHLQPQKAAKGTFASGFPSLVDHEWNFAVGGFGGVSPQGALGHIPVIFVHGNNVDACDWYPVRTAFLAAGWTNQEMYALSYNGLGGNNGNGVAVNNTECTAEHSAMGWDGTTRVTGNDVNVADLYDFILAVRNYTGLNRFSIASHSLGVTVARRTLKVHPELRSDLVAFVGIAGANHGTTFCPPGSEGAAMSCDEIAAGTPWLADLNGPAGSDETYAPARWMTVYDGSGAGDPAYVGPTYAQSPALLGADNRQFPPAYHNDLRLSPSIIAVYRAFLESSEQSKLSSIPPELRTAQLSEALAATGSSLSVMGALLLGAAGVLTAMLLRTKCSV